MIEKLDLNHLRMLSALYEQGTMSAAAEALDVSQQAVSFQLKRVREILGARLEIVRAHPLGSPSCKPSAGSPRGHRMAPGSTGTRAPGP
jgi:molybdenum-dependent DNA-binding transcriptional regulator ModE